MKSEPTEPAAQRDTASRTKGESREDHAEDAPSEPGKTSTASTPPHSARRRIKGMITAKGGKAYRRPDGGRCAKTSTPAEEG